MAPFLLLLLLCGTLDIFFVGVSFVCFICYFVLLFRHLSVFAMILIKLVKERDAEIVNDTQLCNIQNCLISFIYLLCVFANDDWRLITSRGSTVGFSCMVSDNLEHDARFNFPLVSLSGFNHLNAVRGFVF